MNARNNTVTKQPLRDELLTFSRDIRAMKLRQLPNPLLDEAMFLRRQALPHRRRTMLQFAEEEIIIPDGEYAGLRFRCARQPYSRLFFDAVDSDRWHTINALGPTQSGKTLTCFVIPLLYHLFEIGETVICGIPKMDIAADKWREDIAPAIRASRFRDLMPTKGGGSRGGKVVAIKFRNGATLRFMSGGGDDKTRAHFTARVLLITETDGMDEIGSASREADKIRQLLGRTRHYGDRARVYMECTVSIEQGRTWREYIGGTESRILLPCPHCNSWVALERENLTGWRDADDELDAKDHAQWCCPECGSTWTEEERISANASGVLVHRGQEVLAGGEVVGDPPRTLTLGYRWSAVNNLFTDAGTIGAEEWKASRDVDEDSADREMRQFVWSIPAKHPEIDLSALDPHGIAERVTNYPRGVVPAACEHLTLGVDLGKWQCHWVLIAWRAPATGQIVDYGVLEPESRRLGVDPAILAALREFRDSFCEPGWPVGTTDGERMQPEQVWIDSHWEPVPVKVFTTESGDRYQPMIGYGEGQRNPTYRRPTKTSPVVVQIGEEYHIVQQRHPRVRLVEANADHWKTWLHDRLNVPVDQPSALTLFQAPPHEHLSLARHITAEKKVEEFTPKKGTIVRWVKIRHANHYLDAAYIACAAGHHVGVRLLPGTDQQKRATVSLSEYYGQRERRR